MADRGKEPAVPSQLRASNQDRQAVVDGLQNAFVEGRLQLHEYDERVALAYNVLQAAGARTVKAEFVACPSCGRTLFDLQETTQLIKRATGHLRGVKIAVMGCIVNGLGELADADFGYMGGAPDKINLFVGKECVEKGVPTEQAVSKLIDIIKAHGKWVEPVVRA